MKYLRIAQISQVKSSSLVESNALSLFNRFHLRTYVVYDAGDHASGVQVCIFWDIQIASFEAESAFEPNAEQ